jgi:hypothetical protein
MSPFCKYAEFANPWRLAITESKSELTCCEMAFVVSNCFCFFSSNSLFLILFSLYFEDKRIAHMTQPQLQS